MLNTIIPLGTIAPSSSDVLRLDTEGKLPLTVQSFIGQRVGILGTSGMGKSNTLALILEKVLPFMPTVIFDQHDEFWGLCEQYEILRVGKSPDSQIVAGPEQAAQIAEISHSKRLSVLVEMLNMTRQERQDFVEAYCAHIWELNKRAKLPYGIVLEEAQNFIPEGKSTPAQEMMKQFALEGRKFGFTILISTQRSAEVSKTVLGQCGLAFLHGVDIYADVQAYAGMLPYSATETKKIALNLGIGECIVKVKTDGRAQFIHPVKMLRRETFHVGDTPTLDQDAPPPLRAIDGELLAQLQKLLTKKTSPPAPSPITERGNVEDDVAGIANRALGELLAAYVEQGIADLQAKLAAANTAIRNLQMSANPDPNHVREVMAGVNRQPSAGVIAHVAVDRGAANPVSTPAADVQLKLTSEGDGWSGRSKLATVRAIKRQEREFEALLTDIRNAKLMHRLALIYLTQREKLEVMERDLARHTGYSLSSLATHRPTEFERRKLIKRILKGGVYHYQSTVRKALREDYPDLDDDKLIDTICKLEKI